MSETGPKRPVKSKEKSKDKGKSKNNTIVKKTNSLKQTLAKTKEIAFKPTIQMKVQPKNFDNIHIKAPTYVPEKRNIFKSVGKKVGNTVQTVKTLVQDGKALIKSSPTSLSLGKPQEQVSQQETTDIHTTKTETKSNTSANQVTHKTDAFVKNATNEAISQSRDLFDRVAMVGDLMDIDPNQADNPVMLDELIDDFLKLDDIILEGEIVDHTAPKGKRLKRVTKKIGQGLKDAATIMEQVIDDKLGERATMKKLVTTHPDVLRNMIDRIHTRILEEESSKKDYSADDLRKLHARIQRAKGRRGNKPVV